MTKNDIDIQVQDSIQHYAQSGNPDHERVLNKDSEISRTKNNFLCAI